MILRRAAAGLVLLAAAGCAGSAPATTTDPAESAIRTAIDALNATADGPVATQQHVLAQLVAAGQQDVQRRCPAATSTLSFEPVWSDLAPARGWTPPQGTLPGTLYSLPTLIRIHRQGRITGTDLTDLHLAVSGATAALPSLCVG